METTVTIPSADKTQTVKAIRVVPGETTVQVYIVEDGENHVVNVDIATQWAAATVDQKTTIKNFFKAIGALGLDQFNEAAGVDVTTGDVTGDLWD